ncbi:MAG: TonB-dependent siderophore receptor [bacterium]|nr:TonB-dependent siderophore receptor [bacterium]
MRNLFLTAALAALTSFAAVDPVAAQAPTQGDSEPKAGATIQNEESVPAAEYVEELFVEESLPFLPDTNTITAKLPLQTGWTPANVGVVDLETLSEQQARILGHALENVSGINVHTGNGVFDFFVLRGFDSLNSGLVLTDGAPEPETTFYQMYNTERVEVFKGPAGFLYGSNPLAGVINLVRKQPVPQDFGSFSLSLGSWNTADGSIDLNRSNDSGSASFRLNGLFRSGDGYRDGREQDVAAINPAFTWRPDDRTAIHLNLESLSSEYVPDAGLPLVNGALPAVSRDRSYASPFDFSEQDLLRVQLDLERTLSDRLELRNKLYFRELDWKTDGTLLNGAFPSFSTGRIEVFRTLVDLDDRQDFVGNQLELLWSPQDSRHQLLAGVEIARFSDDYSLDVGLLPSIDLLAPVETATRPIFFLPSQSTQGDSTSDIVAPYLIERFQATKKLMLLAGLRLDAIDFEDAVSGASRSQEEVSPMLGIVYSPTEGSAFYINAAGSFAPPSPRVVGEREAEESRQIEVGTRRSSGNGRFRSTFALYRLERDNIAIPDDNGFTQQAGDQRSQGLEVELAGDLARGLSATFSYAYTDSELTRFSELVALPFSNPPFAVFDRSGNSSTFAPEHLANLWLSKTLSNGFRIGGGARFVDDQFISEDNSASISSYVLLNAALSYGRNDWRFGLRLRNLTDEDYETRGFGSSAVIPAEPLSASLSFEYRI